MITFEQIDAAVKAVHDNDPETEALMMSLLANKEFTDKVIGVSISLSKDVLLSEMMNGVTDQRALGATVMETTVVSVAITMLLAGRLLERQSAQSLASLLEGFPEDTTEEEGS